MDSENNNKKNSAVLESQKRYDKYRNDWSKYNDAIYLNDLRLLNMANLTLNTGDVLNYVLKDSVGSILKKITNPSQEKDDANANDKFARLIMSLPNPLTDNCLDVNNEMERKVLNHIRKIAKRELRKKCKPRGLVHIDNYIDEQRKIPLTESFYLSNTLSSLIDYGGVSNINLGKYIGLLSDFEIENNKSILDIELIAVALSNGVIINSKSFCYWNDKINSIHCCQNLIIHFKDYEAMQKFKVIPNNLVKVFYQLLIKYRLITGDVDQAWIWSGKSRDLYRYLAIKLNEYNFMPRKSTIHKIDVLNSYIAMENISDMRRRGDKFVGENRLPLGFKLIDKLIVDLVKNRKNLDS